MKGPVASGEVVASTTHRSARVAGLAGSAGQQADSATAPAFVEIEFDPALNFARNAALETSASPRRSGAGSQTS